MALGKIQSMPTMGCVHYCHVTSLVTLQMQAQVELGCDHAYSATRNKME